MDRKQQRPVGPGAGDAAWRGGKSNENYTPHWDLHPALEQAGQPALRIRCRAFKTPACRLIYCATLPWPYLEPSFVREGAERWDYSDREVLR